MVPLLQVIAHSELVGYISPTSSTICYTHAFIAHCCVGKLLHLWYECWCGTCYDKTYQEQSLVLLHACLFDGTFEVSVGTHFYHCA